MIVILTEHEYYMRRAINLARKGLGHTSPNPMVGAVIVKDGSVISEDYHRKVGEYHAERLAIENAKEDVSGATLYVNLEPCCHHGRTLPCTDIIIKSGIKRVVAAITDPYPEVSGKGIEKLKESGVDVISGILEQPAFKLNEAYIKRVKTGFPFVIYKTAMTLDGKIALSNGESQWITSERSRKYSHFIRSRVDGILTGAKTVINDNPSLDVRLKKKFKNPVPIIFDGNLEIPLNRKLFQDVDKKGTIVFTRDHKDETKIKKLESIGIKVIKVPGKDQFIDLKEAMKIIGKSGMSSIMLECGGNLAYSMLEKVLIDKVYFFIAPKIFGGANSLTSFEGAGINNISDAFKIKNIKSRLIGTDFLIEGYVRKNEGWE